MLIPLFVERNKSESIADALKRTDFEKVTTILKALKEHDEEIAQIINDILESDSRGKGYSQRAVRKLKKFIELNHNEISKDLLFKSIGSRIINNLKLKWD